MALAEYSSWFHFMLPMFFCSTALASVSLARLMLSKSAIYPPDFVGLMISSCIVFGFFFVGSMILFKGKSTSISWLSSTYVALSTLFALLGLGIYNGWLILCAELLWIFYAVVLFLLALYSFQRKPTEFHSWCHFLFPAVYLTMVTISVALASINLEYGVPLFKATISLSISSFALLAIVSAIVFRSKSTITSWTSFVSLFLINALATTAIIKHRFEYRSEDQAIEALMIIAVTFYLIYGIVFFFITAGAYHVALSTRKT